MTKSKQEWESVLEKEWDEDGFLDGLYPNSYKKLIKFINNLILEERQRVVEMIERMYPYEEIEKFKGMDYIEIVQEVKSDLQSKLKEDK